jgi:hypothetical protein
MEPGLWVKDRSAKAWALAAGVSAVAGVAAEARAVDVADKVKAGG